MLTPQEVSEKKFKQAFLGGYDMAGVDSFLESLTADYESLYKENVLLKSKIRVLVDKLEEYRSVDDSMRQALLSAQKMSEKTTTEARIQADRILKEATAKANQSKSMYAEALAAEEARLQRAKTQTQTFISGLCELYSRQSDLLKSLMEAAPSPSPRKVREERTTQAVEDIEKSVMAQIDEVFLETPPAPSLDDTREFKKEQPVQENASEVQSLEFVFGDEGDTDETDLWQPEQDTEIPAPRYEFPDLETQFGPGIESGVKKRK